MRSTLRGAFRSELRVEDLRVDEALPSNGFTLRFRASEWAGAQAVLEQIRTSVAQDRFVPMDGPDVDPDRERTGCEVCGAAE